MWEGSTHTLSKLYSEQWPCALLAANTDCQEELEKFLSLSSNFGHSVFEPYIFQLEQEWWHILQGTTVRAPRSENCHVLSFNQGLSEAGLSAALNKGCVSGAMTLVNQSMGALWSQYVGIMPVSAAASEHTSHTGGNSRALANPCPFPGHWMTL